MPLVPSTAPAAPTRDLATASSPVDADRRAYPVAAVVVLAVLWLGVAVWLQLQREPGAPSYDTIWAEDGLVFYNDAVHKSFLSALLTPYNNYLHLLPRLVGALAAALPPADAAIVLAGGAALVVAVLSAYVYWASGTVVASEPARILLATLTVLLPAAAYETNAAANDLHWYLMFAAFWALLAVRRTRRHGVLAAVVVGAAVLSDPLTVLLLPLGVITGLRQHHRRSWLAPVVLALGGPAQFLVGLGGQQIGRYSATHLGGLLALFTVRLVGSFVLGERYLGVLLGPRMLRAYALTAVVVVIVVAIGLVSRGRGRLLLLAGVNYCIVYFIVPLLIRGRTFGPRWSDGLRQARQLCASAHGAPAAPPGELLPGPGDVVINVSPQVVPHSFRVALPCSRLQ